MVAVFGADAQPVAALLEYRERLAVQCLAHSRGAHRRRGQERRQRGGHHRRAMVPHGWRGQQVEVQPEPRIQAEPLERRERLTTRCRSHEPAPTGFYAHLEDAEARVGNPFATHVGQIALEAVRHAPPPASPGMSFIPRASCTARSTATGTACAASASAWSGVAAGTAAVLTAKTTSPSNRVL